MQFGKLFVFAFVCVASASLLGCDTNRVFERNIDIKNYQWESKDKADFSFEISDTNALYNIYVNVRHADYYQYNNLWLSVTTIFPDGSKTKSRVDVPLANDEGVWFGDGLGDIWDVQHLIQQGAFFNQAGLYHIEIEQLMRRDPLPGIMAIGVRVENTGIRRSNK